jgi:hypothetical protein
MACKYTCYVSRHPSSCFYLKHSVSEIGFCLCLQVEPIQLGPIDRPSPYLRITAPTDDRIYKPSARVKTLKTFKKTPHT